MALENKALLAAGVHNVHNFMVVLRGPEQA
jgi:hypothetical protein